MLKGDARTCNLPGDLEGSSGNLGQDMRRPGPRQGTSVHVHTVIGEVRTGVNLNRYSGNGSCIPWHCDNERLFGSPFEPKVIVSMTLGHSALFKLRRRASENTHSRIRLDHGELLVMDDLTQLEYEHSMASELLGPRVNLTFRWISQHIRS